MMNRTASIAAIVTLFALTGCAQEEENATPEDRQTITGRLETDGARDGIGTRTVVVGRGQLHVVAHRLGTKDRTDASQDVDAVVAADGSFDLKLSRGARYVFELERGADSVAFFGWNTRNAAERTTILGISAATAGKAAVSLGRVKVVGNGAVSEHCLCDSFDASDTTGIDLSATWFVAAHGALISGEEALVQASAALEEASKALVQASAALEEAAAATEEAADAIEEARARAQASRGE